MIEQDTVASEHVVCLAVVDNNPVTIQFGNAIGRARIEGGGLLLGSLNDLTIELRGGGLLAIEDRSH